ncbi:MAG: alpha/beta hydrolase [Thermoplasmata archaeon]|nr:alpha/beta hydrolase [Thermoplasmata archaeon]
MFAELDGISLRYEDSGSGEPVILIAGFGATHAYWGGMRRLLDGYRVVTLDNRGCGETVYNGAFSIDDLADDVVLLADFLGIERFHVLGWSMGTQIAQSLGIRHGGRLKSITLVSAYLWRPARSAYLLNGYTKMAADGEAPTACLAMMVNAMSFPPSVFEKLEARGETMQIPRKLEDPKKMMMQLDAVNAYDTTELASGIQVPTLLVHGREDLMVPLPDGLAVAEKIPNCETLVLDDAGHNILPERYATEFREFIDSHS